MKPIKFEQCNRHIDFEDGRSLDFFKDVLTDKVIVLWQFDEDERKQIADSGQLFISQILGETAVPLLDVPFREITDEERQMIETARKKVGVQMAQEQRNKPNAKRVKLKAVK